MSTLWLVTSEVTTAPKTAYLCHHCERVTVNGTRTRFSLLGKLRHLYIVAVEQVARGVLHGGDS